MKTQRGCCNLWWWKIHKEACCTMIRSICKNLNQIFLRKRGNMSNLFEKDLSDSSWWYGNLKGQLKIESHCRILFFTKLNLEVGLKKKKLPNLISVCEEIEVKITELSIKWMSMGKLNLLKDWNDSRSKAPKQKLNWKKLRTFSLYLDVFFILNIRLSACVDFVELQEHNFQVKFIFEFQREWLSNSSPYPWKIELIEKFSVSIRI